MTTQAPLTKIHAARAAEVCERFELEKAARPLLRPGSTPRELLDALHAAGQHQTAVCFLAHALPAREAVWWSCLCLRKVASCLEAPEAVAAYKAAAAWVLDPTEERRAEAEAAAKAAGRGTPAELLGLAVAWTGGSLAPPLEKVPPVTPGPYLPAKGVYGAVLLAAARCTTPGVQEQLRLFADLGTAVAEGRHPWPDVKPKRPGKTWGF